MSGIVGWASFLQRTVKRSSSLSVGENISLKILLLKNEILVDSHTEQSIHKCDGLRKQVLLQTVSSWYFYFGKVSSILVIFIEKIVIFAECDLFPQRQCVCPFR